jgi:hypothetical protein
MRLLTACCVVALCAFAIFRGWSIVRFADAEARIASHERGIDAIRPWIGTPGLTGTALHTSLTYLANSTDIEEARKRAVDLTTLLAVRPLATMDWLSLAGMRLVRSEPGALAALTMSSVTGPNEGAVMVQRAIFGLLEWETLPADARRRTIADLAEVISADVAADGAMTTAKNILRTKSPEMRSEIAGLLRTDRVLAGHLARIGLERDPGGNSPAPRDPDRERIGRR